MMEAGLRRVTESGTLTWPWSAARGLAVISGATGGGGGGGSGGGITRDGKPLHGNNGQGCNFGRSDGGKGARADETDDRVVANGGDGGRGRPGETVIVELSELSVGDVFQITIGQGGGGGGGGPGFESGCDGSRGIDGHVLFVPVYDKQDAVL